jgi:hypothetical protein
MKGIMIAGLALILAAAVPFTVLGDSRDKRDRGTEHVWGFEVNTHFHAQMLGGESRHACGGLSVAADHSPVVQPVAPPPPSTGSGSGGITGGTFGTVTSSGPATL